jgi:hypothetical protein
VRAARREAEARGGRRTSNDPSSLRLTFILFRSRDIHGHGFTTQWCIYTTLSNGSKSGFGGQVESAVACLISVRQKSPFQFSVGLRESGCN